jgi:hypothetical protein
MRAVGILNFTALKIQRDGDFNAGLVQEMAVGLNFQALELFREVKSHYLQISDPDDITSFKGHAKTDNLREAE